MPTTNLTDPANTITGIEYVDISGPGIFPTYGSPPASKIFPTNIGSVPVDGSNSPPTSTGTPLDTCSWWDFPCFARTTIQGPAGVSAKNAATTPDYVSQYVGQLTIIIVGFIFLFAGLYMFKPNAVIAPNVLGH